MPHTVSFDRIARLYRFAEYLCHGRLLERVRTHFLGELGTRRRALVLGDGDGRFVARLLELCPHTQVLAVDTSAAMLHQLRRRCERLGSEVTARLRTLHGSALTVTPSRETDLVVTHFFLDCLTESELQALAGTLAAALPEGALWLVSDFDLPRRRLLRPLAALYIRTLYAAFRVLTGLRVTRLPAVTEILERAGFTRVARREFAAGLLYTELWELRNPPGSSTRRPHAAQPNPPPPHPPRGMQKNNEMPDRHTAVLVGKAQPNTADAQSNPEPAVPSLPAPDPGVFHHEPAPGRTPAATPRGQEHAGASRA